MKTNQINLSDIDYEVGSQDEYFQFIHIEDGYCPEDYVRRFWEKYSLLDSQIFAYGLQVLAEYHRSHSDKDFLISNETLNSFRMDVANLLKAVYYDHTYNQDKGKIIFVSDAKAGY